MITTKQEAIYLELKGEVAPASIKNLTPTEFNTWRRNYIKQSNQYFKEDADDVVYMDTPEFWIEDYTPGYGPDADEFSDDDRGGCPLY